MEMRKLNASKNKMKFQLDIGQLRIFTEQFMFVNYYVHVLEWKKKQEVKNRKQNENYSKSFENRWIVEICHFIHTISNFMYAVFHWNSTRSKLRKFHCDFVEHAKSSSFVWWFWFKKENMHEKENYRKNKRENLSNWIAT